MIAGVARDVEHEPVGTELGGQLARGVAGVVLVALQAVLHLVRPQLKCDGQVRQTLEMTSVYLGCAFQGFKIHEISAILEVLDSQELFEVQQKLGVLPVGEVLREKIQKLLARGTSDPRQLRLGQDSRGRQ